MILKNILQTLSTKILVVPLGLAMGILTARYLGPADKGYLALLLLIPHTAVIIGNIGVDAASIYLYRRKHVSFDVLLSNTLVFGALVGLTVSGLLWLARDLVAGSLLKELPSIYYLIAVGMVPFLLLVQYLSGLARAQEDFRAYNLRHVCEKLFSLAGVAVVFWILDGRLLACILVFLLVPAAVTLLLVKDLWKHVRGWSRPQLDVLKRTLRFGFKSYAQSLAGHMHYRVDVYLVALYLSSAEVAFYSIGANVAERILMLPTAIAMVVYPRLASLEKQGAAELTARSSRIATALSGATALVLLLVSGPLLAFFYGTPFLPAVRPLNILLAGAVFVGIARILFQYFTSINRHQFNVLILSFSLAVNVLLNLLLIPRYGIEGAAFSSLVTYFLQAGLAVAVFVRLTGLSVERTLLLGSDDLGDLQRLRPAWLRRGAAIAE